MISGAKSDGLFSWSISAASVRVPQNIYPRAFKLALLSNGSYHVMVMADGSGYSRIGSTAITRWREDAALDTGGSYFYLRDADDGSVWSATVRPIVTTAEACTARFDADRATFVRREHGITLTTIVAVSADRDVELRRLCIENLSSRRRSLSVTGQAEVVMDAAATDSAHPAFSKMFIETSIDSDLGAIFASRRSSKRDDARQWCFHLAAVPGPREGMSFESDRMRFIGRGRDAAQPRALLSGEPLSGSDGPVLDPMFAIRLPIALESGAAVTTDWFTGVAGSRLEAEALAAECREAGAGDRVLAQSGRYREQTLARIGASAEDAQGYEALAGALLFNDATRRGSAAAITANPHGQSALWKFGISGDVPLVALRLDAETQPERMRHLLAAHAFWRAHGLASEMIVLCGCNGAAEGDFVGRVRHAAGERMGADVLDKPGGIFIRGNAALGDEDRLLLDAVARIVIDERAAHETAAPGRIETFTAAAGVCGGSGAVAPLLATGDLSDFNGRGGFTTDRREYVITTSASRMTPLPWTNVIANPSFGSVISESGSASTWRENAHEFRLTPWTNDPVSDASGEAFYVRDEATGHYWSPTLLPVRSAGEFVARHGFGYSVFEHYEDDIASELCVFVPTDAPVKLSMVTLRNRSTEARRVSVTGHVDWVLGDERSKTLMHVVTEIDADTGALFARNAYNTDFAGRTAFFDVQDNDMSFGADRVDFFGPGGTRAAPAAMAQARLSGRVGAALDPCATLRVSVELAPGEARTLVFCLGAGKCTGEARDLVRRWRGRDVAHEALRAVQARWRHTFDALQVQTPDVAVNMLVNGWLPYQTLASRLWGRTAFYQSSGAFGFRDQLQDVMALVHAEPALVREHLLRAASRQFVEGDVQHWWHPPSGKGIRTRCSDDYLWLPLAVSRYVEVTGDADVLDAMCPYLESRSLKDGEETLYEAPQAATEAGTLYEHCTRALRRGLTPRGTRGLPLMGAGDWNDGMNLVGVGGSGESVWLAFFLIAVLKRFVPLAQARADTDFAQRCAAEAAALAARVEATSWDGRWYQRATFDDGTALGSADNAECRIDSIAQSWAVLSGAAPEARARLAMDSVHELLVKPHARVVQLIDPPFDRSQPSPGYIQRYPPGVRENGGQYTHAAVWAAMAFAALGDADRAWQLFVLLAPTHHGASPADIATYKLEPYVIAGDVYAFSPHAGRGGWSWYTGSAGWMYQFIVESLLGLERRGNQLRVRPLLPKSWPGFDMSYRFGSTRFEITCRAGEAAADAVDGVAADDEWITLADDGKTRTVALVVRRPG
ncbi:MAG: GH36-type glycosyl hydrolase domain-containing protein [Burkholderiales bacterium]